MNVTDERAALVAAARDEPYDPARRLVYADWLDDHGEAVQAARQREEARVLGLMAERRAYYVHHPRDFANEYDVFAVPASMVGRFEALYPGAGRVAFSRAIDRGLVRPAEAKRDGEQWYGGLRGRPSPDWHDDPKERRRRLLLECCRSTILDIELAEMRAEAAEEAGY